MNAEKMKKWVNDDIESLAFAVNDKDIGSEMAAAHANSIKNSYESMKKAYAEDPEVVEILEIGIKAVNAIMD